ITGEVQAAIDLMIGTLNDKIIEINDALADQQADYTQKISDLTAYVDNAVQQIINNSIEVQDPVVAGLVEDDTSATQRALDDRYGRRIFNVLSYGATGDGESDDTSAIQSAVAAASAEGGTVHLPTGDYVVSDTVEVGSNVHLTGSG